MAFNIVLGSKDHTLIDKEIDDIMNKVINGLKESNIELRK